MTKMELRGIVVQQGININTKKQFRRKLVILRDLATKRYCEYDVTALIELNDKELVERIKKELEKRGIIVIVPSHLKHLEV